MMNLKETLNTVACRVLEQTAFLFPEPADLQDGINFEEFDFIMSKISFSGDKVGEISLIVPSEFCVELSANMLGEDADGNESEKHKDALKETLNIITGQLLIELYGDKAVFNLTPPEVIDLSRDEFFSIISENDYALALSDELPVITIHKLKKESHERSSISG
jgi:CheY-specific phosphatase CheX